MPRRSLFINLVIAVVGAALLVFTVRQVGWASLVSGITSVGWAVVLVVVLGALRMALRARAWIACVDDRERTRWRPVSVGRCGRDVEEDQRQPEYPPARFYYTRVYADPKVKDTVWILNVNIYKSTDQGKTIVNVRVPHGEVLTPRLVDRQARWQAQFGRDFDFWFPNASEMKQLPDRIRAVSQQRLDQLSR